MRDLRRAFSGYIGDGSCVKIDALAHLLPKLIGCNCVVSFSDGDSYEIRNLDIQGFYEDDFEIYAPFEHCLRASIVKQQALDAAPRKIERVWWTSVDPRVPVGKTYLIQDIESIFDCVGNYDLYTKAE